MALSKEDLKEAANRWNWRPDRGVVATPPKKITIADKNKTIARRRIDELKDEMRINKMFEL